MGVNGFIAALASELFMCCILPDSKGLQSRFKEIFAYRLMWFFSVSCNTSDNIHLDHTEALVLILFTFIKPLVTLSASVLKQYNCDGVSKLVSDILGEASVTLCLALKPERKPISFFSNLQQNWEWNSIAAGFALLSMSLTKE